MGIIYETLLLKLLHAHLILPAENILMIEVHLTNLPNFNYYYIWKSSMSLYLLINKSLTSGDSAFKHAFV